MSFIDLIFPKLCLGCNLPGAYLCPRCQKKLNRLDRDRCFYCNKSSLYGLTHPLCLKKFNIDGVVSFYFYNNLLKKILKNIKYRLAKDIGRDFFKTVNFKDYNILAFYNKLSPPIFFQPIPLTKRKLRERGFNQALFVTNFIKKYVDLPIGNFLIKIKETKSQAELKTKMERYQNLRGAFKINHPITADLKNTRVVLVDDVITSGSTIKEAAAVLKKAGCIKVYALTLARG